MLNLKVLFTKILIAIKTLQDDKLSKSGDTLTGDLTIDNKYLIAKSSKEVGEAVDNYTKQISFRDKNGTITGCLGGVYYSDKQIGTQFETQRSVNGTTVYNGIQLKIAEDGTRSVVVSDKNTWKNGLGINDVTTYDHAQFGYESNTTYYATSGGNQPRAYKCGRLVTLSGCIKNTAVLTATNDAVAIGSVPNDCKPITPFRCVAQGSSMNKFLLTIDTNGKIQASRYGTTGSIDFPSGTWLNISCTYISAS